MSVEIYFGNLRECTYAGCAGNFFGVEHDRVIAEGLYFVKIKDDEYILVEELLSNKKKKQTFKSTASKKGEIFVGDLILVNDLIQTKVKTENQQLQMTM